MLTARFLTIIFAVFLIFLYTFGLDRVPVHLNQDELMFSLNAESIVRSGTDYYGNPYPFYFWHLGSLWATPVITYLTAFFLNFFDLSEASIRLPSVFVGLTSVALVMHLTKLLFKDKRLTLISGLLMGTTPALLINSRLLLDNIYIIPVVLIWLILIHKFISSGKIVYLFVVGLTLGFGIHTYHAAKVYMPIYTLATLLMLMLYKKVSFLKSIPMFLLGIVLSLGLFVPWYRNNPGVLLNQVSYVGGIDTTINTEDGFSAVFNTKRILGFAKNYFSYLSPSILFTSGDRTLVHSTGKVGVFLFPVFILMAVGLIVTIINKDYLSKLILFGFMTFPIAPSLINDPDRISRAFVVIPFGVMLATYGVNYLLSQKERVIKGVLIFILLTSAIQFNGFIKNYSGDYRVISSPYFNRNIGGLFESVVKSTRARNVNLIYIDVSIYYGSYYFDFFQKKLGEDLISKVIMFDPNIDNFTNFPDGSIVAISASSAPIGKPDFVNGFEKIEIIRELDGVESYYVYWDDED